jgi:MFS family permease
LVIRTPAFNNPDYRRLWLGAACNHLGMSGEQVIIGLLVIRITQSTAWVGIALALYFLPMFVIGALSGAIADRMDRRILLRRIEIFIAANMLVFAALTIAGLLDLWLVLAFTAIAGGLRALHQPVRISYAYDIAGNDHVVGSIALLNLGTRIGQLVGALLAGAAVERVGAPGIFVALATIHAIAFASFCRLRTAGIAEIAPPVPMRRNLLELFDEMRLNRMLLMLVIITASVEVFGFSFSTTLPELATARFEFGAEGLGMMQAVRALGGLIASAALSATRELQRDNEQNCGNWAFFWLRGLSFPQYAVCPVIAHKNIHTINPFTCPFPGELGTRDHARRNRPHRGRREYCPILVTIRCKLKDRN